MKNKSLLLSTITSIGWAPIVVVACSNNVNNDATKPTNEMLVDQEIARIEQLKDQLSLKIKNPTEADIQKLNADNILNNLNNWTEGIIANQTNAKFTYIIKEFTNGLNSKDLSEKTLSFKIAVKYQDVQKETSLIEIKYQIETNPTKPPTPEIPSDQLLNPDGGTISNTNLKTSSYNNLITALDLLSNTTYLPELNDQKLTQAINEKPELKDVSLTIAQGSNTLNGILKLKLVSPTIKETIIEISGFQIYQQTTNQSLQYHTFKINNQNWFDLLLPINKTKDVATQISKVDSPKWNQVLDDFKILLADGSSQNFGSAKDLKTQGFYFDIKATYDQKTETINLQIDTKYDQQEYKNQQWIKQETLVWNQPTNSKSSFNILKEKDLYQFIINQTKIDEAILKSHVPSYYLAKDYFYKKLNAFNTDDQLLNNDYLEKPNFKDYYLPSVQRLTLIFVVDSIRADDWNNTLSFQIGLALDDEVSNAFKQFNFENQNKSIATILENQLTTNSVQIKKDSSSLRQKIIKHLKDKHKTDVDQLFNSNVNKSKSYNDFSTNQIPQIIKQSFPNYEIDNDLTWANLEKEINISLFNKPINLSQEQSFNFPGSDTLSFSSHLFWLNQDDAFVIKNIQYQFNENQVKIKLTNLNPNLIKIELEGSTLINFSGDTEQSQKIIPTSFYFELNKGEW